MKARAMAVRNIGLVTSLGLNAPSTCAALRAGLSNAVRGTYSDAAGERLAVHKVQFERAWKGRACLRKMLGMAILESLIGQEAIERQRVPLILCVAEHERAGRPFGIEDKLFEELQRDLGLKFDLSRSRTVALGRVGPLVALNLARQYLNQHDAEYVLVAGVDSLLIPATLGALEGQGRLLTANNANGFIAGEGAGAVLFARWDGSEGEVICSGLGEAIERAHLASGQPLRADGLAAAIRAAVAEASTEIHNIDFRIADVSGEQYYFKEASLAIGRLLREHKEEFDLWHPAEGVGEVGAAAAIVMMGCAWMAFQKRYACGPRALLHAGSDDGHRAAAVFECSRRL